MVSISACERLRSLRNAPCARSACHGGITRDATFSLIAPAHGRTSLNEVSDMGATSPGRWQLAHLVKTIGATSLLNVGVCALAGPAPNRTSASARDLDVIAGSVNPDGGKSGALTPS